MCQVLHFLPQQSLIRIQHQEQRTLITNICKTRNADLETVYSPSLKLDDRYGTTKELQKTKL